MTEKTVTETYTRETRRRHFDRATRHVDDHIAGGKGRLAYIAIPSRPRNTSDVSSYTSVRSSEPQEVRHLLRTLIDDVRELKQEQQKQPTSEKKEKSIVVESNSNEEPKTNELEQLRKSVEALTAKFFLEPSDQQKTKELTAVLEKQMEIQDLKNQELAQLLEAQKQLYEQKEAEKEAKRIAKEERRNREMEKLVDSQREMQEARNREILELLEIQRDRQDRKNREMEELLEQQRNNQELEELKGVISALGQKITGVSSEEKELKKRLKEEKSKRDMAELLETQRMIQDQLEEQREMLGNIDDARKTSDRLLRDDITEALTEHKQLTDQSVQELARKVSDLISDNSMLKDMIHQLRKELDDLYVDDSDSEPKRDLVTRRSSTSSCSSCSAAIILPPAAIRDGRRPSQAYHINTLAPAEELADQTAKKVLEDATRISVQRL